MATIDSLQPKLTQTKAARDFVVVRELNKHDVDLDELHEHSGTSWQSLRSVREEVKLNKKTGKLLVPSEA